eukprot:23237-Prorocentrum_minimum.AAC.3
MEPEGAFGGTPGTPGRDGEAEDGRMQAALYLNIATVYATQDEYLQPSLSVNARAQPQQTNAYTTTSR